MRWVKDNLRIDLDAAQGSFAASVKSYRIRIHSVQAASLRWGKGSIAKAASLSGAVHDQPSWTSTQDRFGDVVEIRAKAGVQAQFELSGAVFSKR